MSWSQSVYVRLFVWLLLISAALGAPREAAATPIYAIRAANTCDTCHIEPIGWKNPDQSARLCTMGCNGCHVNITGGGLRTPSGQFYGRQTLPTWGDRPGDYADLSQYRQYQADNAPTKGRYSLLEGFSGWWGGTKPMAEIPDRFGNIDPDPEVLVGADVRLATFGPLESGGERSFAVFPMEADVHVAWRVAERVQLYASGGLKGSRQDPDTIPLSDYFTAREVFAKLDRLPGNSQIRVGRFTPAYGWRLPDHTTFTRRNLGFDQNRQVFGVDAIYNPNYLVIQGGPFYQGVPGWPGETGDEGFGATLMGGWRDLGWQLLGSLHALQRPEGFDELAGGVSWGLNLSPLVYLGELDARRQSGVQGVEDVHALFAYHELNWLVTRGFTALLKYDWQDPNLRLLDDHGHRATLGLQWQPYTWQSIDLQYRMNFIGDFSPDTLGEQDLLAIWHFWY
jgi:hypothetical protein